MLSYFADIRCVLHVSRQSSSVSVEYSKNSRHTWNIMNYMMPMSIYSKGFLLVFSYVSLYLPLMSNIKGSNPSLSFVFDFIQTHEGKHPSDTMSFPDY